MTILEELQEKYQINLSREDEYKLNKFCKWLFQNSKSINGYFPYKPYLVLSIMESTNSFNDKISLKQIADFYFKHIVLNPSLNWYSNYRQLNKWHDAYFKQGKVLTEEAIKHILKNPLGKHRLPTAIFSNLNNEIVFHFSKLANNDVNKLRLLIMSLLVICIDKCTNNYNIPDNSIFNTSDLELDKEQQVGKVVLRIHQAQWSMIIREKFNNKCFICDENMNEVLESAHIQPYSECKYAKDKYSIWNGILLCSNHHRMFDKCFIIKKENNEYVFYLKNDDINNMQKEKIDKLLFDFRDKVNKLVSRENLYRKYFDFLVDSFSKNDINN